MKIIAQVGFAAAALTAAASLAMPASAADLGGWGRGSIREHHAPAAAAPVSPCYFRSDVGYSWSNSPSLRWSAWSGTSYNERVTNTSMEDTWTGGVGLGCGSGSTGFRYELMLGYHGTRGIHGRTQPYNVGTALAPIMQNNTGISSAITTYTSMINAYFDLGNFRGFVPYFGIGIGLAYHQMDEYTLASSPNFPNVPWKVHGDNDLTFAWNMMVGFAYQVSERAILDLGYRYIDFGRAATARHDVFAGGNLSRLTVDEMGAHEIKLGLRYHMGGSCCAGPALSPLK